MPISEAAIERIVRERGPLAAGVHYRRSYQRAKGQYERYREFSPEDTTAHARLQNRMRDALGAMDYIAKKYFRKEWDERQREA